MKITKILYYKNLAPYGIMTITFCNTAVTYSVNVLGFQTAHSVIPFLCQVNIYIKYSISVTL